MLALVRAARAGLHREPAVQPRRPRSTLSATAATSRTPRSSSSRRSPFAHGRAPGVAVAQRRLRRVRPAVLQSRRRLPRRIGTAAPLSARRARRATPAAALPRCARHSFGSLVSREFDLASGYEDPRRARATPARGIRQDRWVAVTQQLARLTSEELVRCRSSVEVSIACARSDCALATTISISTGRRNRSN